MTFPELMLSLAVNVGKVQSASGTCIIPSFLEMHHLLKTFHKPLA